MRSFAIVIRRAYFEAKKRRNYAKNVVVNRSVSVKNCEGAPASMWEKSQSQKPADLVLHCFKTDDTSSSSSVIASLST